MKRFILVIVLIMSFTCATYAQKLEFWTYQYSYNAWRPGTFGPEERWSTPETLKCKIVLDYNNNEFWIYTNRTQHFKVLSSKTLSLPKGKAWEYSVRHQDGIVGTFIVYQPQGGGTKIKVILNKLSYIYYIMPLRNGCCE